MNLAAVPFVVEGVRAYATQRQILRTYLLVPGALTATLLVTWPQGLMNNVYRGSSITDAFTVVAVTFLFFLLYLSGRYGAEDYAPESLGDLREYVTLTRTSIVSLVAGKGLFAVLHTAFLLLLAAPFLVAAHAVSGAPAGALGEDLAILGCSALAGRMYGLFLLSVFGQRKLLRGTLYIVSVAGFILVSWLTLPAVNPAAVLIAVRAGVHAGFCVLLYLAIALFLMASVVLVLALTRQGAQRGGADRG